VSGGGRRLPARVPGQVVSGLADGVNRATRGEPLISFVGDDAPSVLLAALFRDVGCPGLCSAAL
jgi:hypothetical protein